MAGNSQEGQWIQILQIQRSLLQLQQQMTPAESSQNVSSIDMDQNVASDNPQDQNEVEDEIRELEIAREALQQQIALRRSPDVYTLDEEEEDDNMQIVQEASDTDEERYSEHGNWPPDDYDDHDNSEDEPSSSQSPDEAEVMEARHQKEKTSVQNQLQMTLMRLQLLEEQTKMQSKMMKDMESALAKKRNRERVVRKKRKRQEEKQRAKLPKIEYVSGTKPGSSQLSSAYANQEAALGSQQYSISSGQSQVTTQGDYSVNVPLHLLESLKHLSSATGPEQLLPSIGQSLSGPSGSGNSSQQMLPSVSQPQVELWSQQSVQQQQHQQQQQQQQQQKNDQPQVSYYLSQPSPEPNLPQGVLLKGGTPPWLLPHQGQDTLALPGPSSQPPAANQPQAESVPTSYSPDFQQSGLSPSPVEPSLTSTSLGNPSRLFPERKLKSILKKRKKDQPPPGRDPLSSSVPVSQSPTSGLQSAQTQSLGLDFQPSLPPPTLSLANSGPCSQPLTTTGPQPLTTTGPQPQPGPGFPPSELRLPNHGPSPSPDPSQPGSSFSPPPPTTGPPPPAGPGFPPPALSLPNPGPYQQSPSTDTQPAPNFPPPTLKLPNPGPWTQPHTTGPPPPVGPGFPPPALSQPNPGPCQQSPSTDTQPAPNFPPPALNLPNPGPCPQPPRSGVSSSAPGMPLPGPGMPPPGPGMPPPGPGMQQHGQNMPPPGPGMPPPGPDMRPPGPGMQQHGQSMPGPGMPPPGPGMQQHGQNMPPPGLGMQQYGQRMPPPGPGMQQHGQNMPPPGPGMQQYGQRMPPPGPDMPPPGPGMQQYGPNMPPHGQGMQQHGPSMPSHGQGMQQHGPRMPPPGPDMPPPGPGVHQYGPRMPPPGPDMPPPGPGMQQYGPRMKPPQQGRPPPGMQQNGPGIPPHGQGMQQFGQRMRPPGLGMPPPGPGMPGPGMQQHGQRMPPPGMQQHGQGMPPPGPGMPPYGQRMPPPGPNMQQPGPGMPPYRQRMPPRGPGMPPYGQDGPHFPSSRPGLPAPGSGPSFRQGVPQQMPGVPFDQRPPQRFGPPSRQNNSPVATPACTSISAHTGTKPRNNLKEIPLKTKVSTSNTSSNATATKETALADKLIKFCPAKTIKKGAPKPQTVADILAAPPSSKTVANILSPPPSSQTVANILSAFRKSVTSSTKKVATSIAGNKPVQNIPSKSSAKSQPSPPVSMSSSSKAVKDMSMSTVTMSTTTVVKASLTRVNITTSKKSTTNAKLDTSKVAQALPTTSKKSTTNTKLDTTKVARALPTTSKTPNTKPDASKAVLTSSPKTKDEQVARKPSNKQLLESSTEAAQPNTSKLSSINSTSKALIPSVSKSSTSPEKLNSNSAIVTTTASTPTDTKAGVSVASPNSTENLCSNCGNIGHPGTNCHLPSDRTQKLAILQKGSAACREKLKLILASYQTLDQDIADKEIDKLERQMLQINKELVQINQEAKAKKSDQTKLQKNASKAEHSQQSETKTDVPDDTVKKNRDAKAKEKISDKMRLQESVLKEDIACEKASVITIKEDNESNDNAQNSSVGDTSKMSTCEKERTVSTSHSIGEEDQSETNDDTKVTTNDCIDRATTDENSDNRNPTEDDLIQIEAVVMQVASDDEDVDVEILDEDVDVKNPDEEVDKDSVMSDKESLSDGCHISQKEEDGNEETISEMKDNRPIGGQPSKEASFKPTQGGKQQTDRSPVKSKSPKRLLVHKQSGNSGSSDDDVENPDEEVHNIDMSDKESLSAGCLISQKEEDDNEETISKMKDNIGGQPSKEASFKPTQGGKQEMERSSVKSKSPVRSRSSSETRTELPKRSLVHKQLENSRSSIRTRSQTRSKSRARTSPPRRSQRSSVRNRLGTGSKSRDGTSETRTELPKRSLVHKQSGNSGSSDVDVENPDEEVHMDIDMSDKESLSAGCHITQKEEDDNEETISEMKDNIGGQPSKEASVKPTQGVQLKTDKSPVKSKSPKRLGSSSETRPELLKRSLVHKQSGNSGSSDVGDENPDEEVHIDSNISDKESLSAGCHISLKEKDDNEETISEMKDNIGGQPSKDASVKPTQGGKQKTDRSPVKLKSPTRSGSSSETRPELPQRSLVHKQLGNFGSSDVDDENPDEEFIDSNISDKESLSAGCLISQKEEDDNEETISEMKDTIDGQPSKEASFKPTQGGKQQTDRSPVKSKSPKRSFVHKQSGNSGSSDDDNVENPDEKVHIDSDISDKESLSTSCLISQKEEDDNEETISEMKDNIGGQPSTESSFKPTQGGKQETDRSLVKSKSPIRSRSSSESSLVHKQSGSSESSDVDDENPDEEDVIDIDMSDKESLSAESDIFLIEEDDNEETISEMKQQTDRSPVKSKSPKRSGSSNETRTELYKQSGNSRSSVRKRSSKRHERSRKRAQLYTRTCLSRRSRSPIRKQPGNSGSSVRNRSRTRSKSEDRTSPPRRSRSPIRIKSPTSAHRNERLQLEHSPARLPSTSAMSYRRQQEQKDPTVWVFSHLPRKYKYQLHDASWNVIWRRFANGTLSRFTDYFKEALQTCPDLPQVIVIDLGENDLLRQLKMKNYTPMIKRAVDPIVDQLPACRIIFCGVRLFCDGNCFAYTKCSRCIFNRSVRNLLKDYKCARFFSRHPVYRGGNEEFMHDLRGAVYSFVNPYDKW